MQNNYKKKLDRNKRLNFSTISTITVLAFQISSQNFNITSCKIYVKGQDNTFNFTTLPTETETSFSYKIDINIQLIELMHKFIEPLIMLKFIQQRAKMIL